MSKKLNELSEKPIIAAKVNTSDILYKSNHLLSMDDIKIFAYTEEKISEMLKVISQCLKKTGLELNIDKSVINTKYPGIPEFDTHEGYKYLGVYENKDGDVMGKNLIRIINEIKERTELLTKTSLTGHNFARAFNQWAGSMIHYYIGIIEFDNNTIENIDSEVRKILIKNKFHFKGAAPERLYLNRNSLGRGINKFEHKIERLQARLYSKYADKAKNNKKYQALLEFLNENNRNIIMSTHVIKQKYFFKKDISDNDMEKNIEEEQQNSLIEKVFKKNLHKVHFENSTLDGISLGTSTLWLR